MLVYHVSLIVTQGTEQWKEQNLGGNRYAGDLSQAGRAGVSEVVA